MEGTNRATIGGERLERAGLSRFTEQNMKKVGRHGVRNVMSINQDGLFWRAGIVVL